MNEGGVDEEDGDQDQGNHEVYKETNNQEHGVIIQTKGL
jgi:hypothetical protein